MFSKITAAALAAAAVACAQQLPKAGMPDLDYWKLANAMRAQMPFAPSYSRDYWGAGWIPQQCYDEAMHYGLNPADFTVFNAHYGDCGDAWVVCRHKDAPAGENNILEMLGRLPVGMRQFIRHFIALGNVEPWGAQTSSVGDIKFYVEVDMSILAHEVSHSMDWNARNNPSNTFSSTSTWQNAYWADQYTPTDYGRTNWMEDLAEAGKIGVSDAYLKGGFGSITVEWSTIQNQYKTYENFFSEFIARGKQCTRRFTNTPAVSMYGRKRAIGAKPDVSISSNVTVIEPSAHIQTIKCQLPHDHKEKAKENTKNAEKTLKAHEVQQI